MHPMHQQGLGSDLTHLQPASSTLVSSAQLEDPRMDSTMTVLEDMDSASQQHQQQLAMMQHHRLHPQQHQHQQVAHLSNQVQQHHHIQQQPLVQQQQPQLHQLQPMVNLAQNDPVIQQHQHHQTSQEGESRQNDVNQNAGGNPTSGCRSRQNQQLDGIVADGGGPIVQWLLDNYEIADGESLPRSTVYNHYLSHCRQLQMASVNAASFGKLIRSVFVGLKTRRLGTRGHSKYHYFGVRAKQHICHELIQHHQDHGSQICSGVQAERATNSSCSSAATNQINNENSNHNVTSDPGSESDSIVYEPVGQNKRLRRSPDNQTAHQGTLTSTSSRLNNGEDNNQQQHQNLYNESNTEHSYQQHQQHHHAETAQYYHLSNGYSSGCKNGLANMDQSVELNMDLRNHLGANWATLVDEHWPAMDHSLPDRLRLLKCSETLISSIGDFESSYKSHYKRIVGLLSELRFDEVEMTCQEFWQPTQVQEQSQTTLADQSGWIETSSANQMVIPKTTEPENHYNHQQNYQQIQNAQHSHQQHHERLNFETLYQLTSQPDIVDRVNQVDYSLFAAIESFLLPDMLSPIPRALAHQIRVFAKNFGPAIEAATKDYEAKFAADKSRSARAFGYVLRRCTWLNHLSATSRSIWEKRSSLAQMSIDLSRVDVRDIEHQVSLMGNVGASLQPASSSNSPVAHKSQQAQSTESRILGESISDHETNNENDLAASSHNSQQPHQHHLCPMQPGQLIQNFLHLLEDPYPVNSWPDWCRNLVESRVCGLSVEEANNFVLKWNFYISLIMKELTLRSAKSFGSFLLIRLLFDEYISYLVVTRLAQAQNKTPAQLMSF